MRRALAVASVVATSVAAGVFGFVGTASADPSADDWYQLRMCESTNQYDINTGNGYYGAYQFDLSTWQSVGGSGRPDQASPEEQDYRALVLYRQRGWEPWVCAGLVGLSDDGDAGSGVAPPVGGNQGGGGGSEGSGSGGSGGSDNGSGGSGGGEATGGAPGWPGRTYSQGDYSEDLKAWQKQMGSRGYDLVGTGYFGPKTEAAVLDLQAKAGLNVVGYIGPKTWAAAWSDAASGGGSGSSGGGSGSSDGGYTPPTADSCSLGSSTAPAWPERQFVEGDTDAQLQCFQKQLATRGYGLIGTGFYGPNTKAAVVDFQTKQGINPSGIIGPKTWAAAWEGN